MEKIEKNIVDNAIILAAGMSSRLAPLSHECPKALLKVKGERLIERQIKQLKAAGITEVIVVVGYRKELFEYLKEIQGIIVVENKEYVERNNYSSLYAARKYLKNSYICCGDHYFTENLFVRQEEKPFYWTVFEEGRTGEWCVQSNDQGCIEQVEVGGENVWIMRGAAYFTESFSRKILSYIEEIYRTPGREQVYWEDIYVDHIQELRMWQKKFLKEQIWEFDNLDDLRKFDATYLNHTNSRIMEEIALKLNCQEAEIVQLIPCKENQLVRGINFSVKNKKYYYDYKDKKISEIEV